MPIAEMKQAHNAKSIPLGILNKGPEFFRQQALRNQRHRGKTAAEQLAESRSQFLKWDPDVPRKQLNDNSNNHSTDIQIDSNRTDLKQTSNRLNSPLVQEHKAVRQERIDELEKHESRKGRDKNRDNRRSRKRMKERGNDVNGNSNKTIAFEKASLDSPEHDKNLKETKNPKVSENGEETPDDAGSIVQSRIASSEVISHASPRPSVKEMISKIGSEQSNGGTVDETASRLVDQSGRQRPKRNLNFVSSESSETSPVLPRRGDYFSRNMRPPAMRGRERTRPSTVAKPRSKVVNAKSPTGSHVQNVLNVLHQQASTSSSSHDETPRRNFRKGGSRVRGKSCPPTSRSKPSLADLLAKDAEGGRPRSKDLNDLDNLTSPESDDSNIVKARIKSFQSPASRKKESLVKSLSEKLSSATSDGQMPSMDSSSNHSLSKRKYPSERQIRNTTPSNHLPTKHSLNSTLSEGVEGKAQLKGKLEICQDPSEMYSLPQKQKNQTIAHRRRPSSSDASHCSASSDKDVHVEKPVLHPKLFSDEDSTPSSKKPLLKSKSADVGLKSKAETSWSSVHSSSSGKPALPKKPELSILQKPTRLSYHFYEVVTDPIDDPVQETTVNPKDNVFENPAHFSDPEESFEVVPDVNDPVAAILPARPDNVAIVAEDREEGKEDPKQGSMFSSLSSHMKRLKGMLLREKDPQTSPKEPEKSREEQQSSEMTTKKKLPDEQLGLFAKNSKKTNFQSPTQKKLAAQLGLECKEKVSEFNFDSLREKCDESTPFSYEGQSHKISPGSTGSKNEKVHDSGTKNVKLMQPVHSKSFSWDDLSKKMKLKTSLSDNTSLATSGSDDKPTKGKSERPFTSSHAPFRMPHDKQKQDLSKKLELFLKKSKAYDSPGNSPSKGSGEAGKLKKKVSFDDTGLPEAVEKKSEMQPLIRKVSITPLNQNYDEVEYNMDLKKDLVEETIIIDSSNSIRLATPRSKQSSSSSDTGVTQKNNCNITEDSAEDLRDAVPKMEGKEISGTEEVEMMVELYADPGPDLAEEKPLDKEPSSDDNRGGASGRCQKTSKLVDFRKASVSTDLDTSPTHDYRGVPLDGHSEIKHRSGTSSSGNARAKGEYDTSSRSDDCGLGATKGRVKHLKPYNARPFRNKNFSSDEDVIPEEHTRKSFWQTKAQLDLPNSKAKTGQAVQQGLEGHESSGDGNTSAESSSMRRSKSEPSNATSAQELDQFFDRMGLDDSILEVASKPHIYDEEEVFHEMHVWRTRAHRGSESDDSNTSYAMSETSNVSEEGVMNLRKFTKQLPDQSMSIVTKNARVIKWMCQCKKAGIQSLS